MMMGKQVRRNAQHDSLPTSMNDQFGPRPFAAIKPTHGVPSKEPPDSASHFGHSFADVDLIPRPIIQLKLRLGTIGDKCEQEADRVARWVVETISSSGHESMQEQEDEEELELEETLEVEEELRRKVASIGPAAGGADVGLALESAIQRAQFGGVPLTDDVRQPMERAFGADFGSVRVHDDREADRLNRSLQARAFTTGQDIFFQQGEYNPGRLAGQELLAHELTHTIQQGTATLKSKIPRKRMKQARGSTADFTTKSPTGGCIDAQSACTQHIFSHTIQRWSGNEHRYFGDQAARRVFQGLRIRIGHQMISFGQGARLGGDWTGSPEELLTGSPEELAEGIGPYLNSIVLASTNVNHFFPLASREWKVQHDEARRLARMARSEYIERRNFRSARHLFNEALMTEAFADHFLQDSYASGHQYPRALDAISARNQRPWLRTALTGLVTSPMFAMLDRNIISQRLLTAYTGYVRAKNYHDLLCKLERGLPLMEGRFHGDDTRNSQDERVTDETYYSLKEIVNYYYLGYDPSVRKAHPSAGPDVPGILADNAIDPGTNRSPSDIWSEMTKAIAKDRTIARELPTAELKTDAGTRYTAREITEAMRRSGWAQYILPRIFLNP